jgi:phage-related protein
MANEISIQFNSLALDTTTHCVSKIDYSTSNNVSQHSIPKSDETIIETPTRGPLSIGMDGTTVGTDYDDLRTNLDALKAALKSGSQKFTIDDDRYVMAVLKSFKFEIIRYRRMAKWSADFIAGFPFWLAENAASDERVPTSGVTYNLTNNGNAPARCKIEITADGGAVADACAIANTTNGEGFRFTGTIANTKKLEVDNRYDTGDFEVLNDGADAHVNFEGDFITLDPGVNAVSFTGTASTTVKFTWRDTYEA